MRQYKIGDELTGGEALDYLSLAPGEHFVMAKIGCSWIYTFKERTLFCCNDGAGHKPGFVVTKLQDWIGFEFTVCPDPSQPEAKVSQYDRDIENLPTLLFGNHPESYKVRFLVAFLERHFVRKEP